MAKASLIPTSDPAPVATVPNPAPAPAAPPVEAPTDTKARSAHFREAFALAVALTGALGNDADARALDAALDTLKGSIGCSLSLVGAGVTVTLHGGIGQSSAWRYVIGAKDASIGRNALATDLRRKPEARRYAIR